MALSMTDKQIAAEIRLVFPTRSGRHDLYADAMHLVGARHEKSELVALVTWLLARHDDAAKALRETHDMYCNGLECPICQWEMRQR